MKETLPCFKDERSVYVNESLYVDVKGSVDVYIKESDFVNKSVDIYFKGSVYVDVKGSEFVNKSVYV